MAYFIKYRDLEDMRLRYLNARTMVAAIRATPENPIPWPGKRQMTLCATLGSANRPRGKIARKTAFAAKARKVRKWLAAYKIERLATGKYYLPDNPPHFLAGAKIEVVKWPAL